MTSSPPVASISDFYNFHRGVPSDTLSELEKKYGEIYGLLPTAFTASRISSQTYVVNTHMLASEILRNQDRFPKAVAGPLSFVRNYLTRNALLTAEHQEHNDWSSAHKILSPWFAQKRIPKWAFNGMDDITQQLALKWQRFGSSYLIDPSEEFSRLVLDVVGLSLLNWRFNSFYDSQPVLFAVRIKEFVKEAVKSSMAIPTDWTTRHADMGESSLGQAQSDRPPIDSGIVAEAFESNAKLILESLKTGKTTSKASPAGKRTFLRDILDQMKDKDGNADMDAVLRQLASIFIAATGPTSGLLSFAMYELLKNEAAYQKVQSEIDKVLESDTCTADHLDRFPYITAVLRETLRLHPTVPAYAVLASEKTIIGGKYEIEEGSTIIIHDRSIQRDTHENAWGPDANEFKPERMQGLEFEENGMTKDMRFKPFGNGSRSCLGHEFAMTLAKLVIVSLFQRFDFRLADTSYELRHKHRIALQPSGLRIIASPRGATIPAAASTPSTNPSTTPIPVVPAPETKKEQPIYILWGGRDGTCENYAETLSRYAPANGKLHHSRASETTACLPGHVGYKPIMAELNRYSGKGKLPTDGPVIIIAATYSGFPTANAEDFYNELLNSANSETNEYEGVRYGVFGCGRSGWSNTYQKIPIALDEMLAKCGAKRFIKRGEFDAGKPITADAFDDWRVRLWAELEQLKIYNVTRDDSLYREVYEIRKVGSADSRHRILRQRETIAAVVVENRVISKPDPDKSGQILPARHLELQMKPDELCHYQPGDIVSILPTNSVESVRRVFAHFKIALEQDFRAEKLSDSVFNSLPAGERVKLFELLVNYVEIGKPAQKSHLRELMNHTKNEATNAILKAEIDSNLKNTIKEHMSVLDYLEKYSDIEIPFNKFFFMLPQMRTREYSISSSARWNPNRLTLSYQEHKKGVSSGYLARLMPGDVVRFTHRLSSHVMFGLPERPSPERSPEDLVESASTPVVMFATGTGIAPFRAMIQDRSEQAKRGVKVGKMTLFFGCRDPEKDYLYGNSDLKEWSDQGILDMRPAFSQVGKHQRIQNRVSEDKEDIKRAYFEGARFLTCGNVGASEGLMEVGAQIVKEGYQEQGRGEISRKDAEKFISDSQIYFTDVFG